MKSRSSMMASKAGQALTAAICAFNRPNDPYRIEQFAILLGNAWELLLKARILQLNKNSLSAIAVYEQKRLQGGTLGQKRYRKKSRSGNTMTIGALPAFDRLVNKNAEPVPAVVRENFEAVIEIRDTCVHFVHVSSAVLFEAHEVFTASVSNLLELMREWFDLSYDHLGPTYLPLALAGKDLEVLAKGSEQRLVSFLQQGKRSTAAGESERFHFGLRVTVEAKKSSSQGAAQYRLTRDSTAQSLRLEEEDFRDRFPWTYEQVRSRCKDRYTDFKQNKAFHDAIGIVKQDPTLHHRRLLNKDNPKSSGQDFYSPNIWKVLDKHWRRRAPELAA